MAGFADTFIVDGFSNNSAAILENKFNLSLQTTGLVMSIPDIIIFILGLPLAIVLDRTGKRGYTMVGGFFLLAISMVLFGFLGGCHGEDL